MAALYWEHEGNRAVRQGDRKLVAKNGGPWKLYHLAHVRTDMHELAAAHPDKPGELAEMHSVWAKPVQAEPWSLK